MTTTEPPQAELGSPAPPFALQGADGQTYTLESFESADVLVAVFTCNHCPYSQHVRPKLIDLAGQYRGESVQFVAINPNDPTSYPEDAPEKMKEDRYAYPYPYLFDGSQDVARMYGAVCTPDVYVYDNKRHLAYRGRVDDDRNPMAPTTPSSFDLKEAIDAVLAGNRPSETQHPSMGCSIKWKEE